MRFYSNGKLLLTGEYVVLDGAKSLAIPTKFGQDLRINKIKEPILIWASLNKDNNCWFEATFDLPKLRLKNASFNSEMDGGEDKIAETLLSILISAKELNPNFLNIEHGLIVKTKLSFPKNWGLGSSSTLINNIATWAKVNPFELLWNSFSGSGYDIACANHKTAIFYTLENRSPIIKASEFLPNFKDELFFIHLNKKQNSRDGITQYKKIKNNLTTEINNINSLTDEFANCKSSKDLAKVIVEHEKIISKLTKQETVQKKLFKDYFGNIKSLGAWGGDFILATGNQDTANYFKKKGYKTIINYDNMVL